MPQPLISVIVPVYKAEPYLERCVSSIRNQTYTNLEIILVDDGSPDRCGEMCDEFAKEDPRIRVFHKENGGQSSARNLGLDNMTGEYVGFVDSDDWIEKDMYQRLYQLLIDHNAQISACGSVAEHLDGRKTYLYQAYPRDKMIRVFSMMESLRECMINQRVTYSLWDKLYHRDIFKDLRMTEGRIFEDMEIMPRCLERVECVVYDPEPLYFYNLSEGSTLRSAFTPRKFVEADVALEKAEDYRKRYPELYDLAMARYIAICLNIIHISSGVDSCTQQRKKMIQDMRGKLPKSAINSLRKKEKIKLAILRFNPVVYEMLMCVYDQLMKIKN